jgi:hypothetical protein
MRPGCRHTLTGEVRTLGRVVERDPDDGPLWLPEEDGWDVSEWGADDPLDPPSLYTMGRGGLEPTR